MKEKTEIPRIIPPEKKYLRDMIDRSLQDSPHASEKMKKAFRKALAEQEIEFVMQGFDRA